MIIWSNTNTLAGYVDDLEFSEDKSTAEVALIGGKAIVLSEFPKLKGIFKTGVGTDNIPFEEARERGIQIRLPSESTSAWIFEETANFACYLCMRMLYDNAGILETWTKHPRRALGHQTVLVIGVGNIGRRVADKMSVFTNVITYDVAFDPSESLKERIEQADVISLHIPLFPETKSFFDAEKMSWMKKGAALVNTSRGGLVDEGALVSAIQNEQIRAAFDVFWKEPYHGPLRSLPSNQFLMTPHLASTCHEFLQGCAIDFREFCDECK